MTLSAKGLRKRYEERSVLDGVDLEIRSGEAVALLGPSGSGKSSLLHILARLEDPDAGELSQDGVDVLSLRGKELDRYRASSVGLVFQDHHLLPQLTAIENAFLPQLAANKPNRHQVQKLLVDLGLGDRMDALPARLSGGERQRVALVRALANDPPLLLCDEPTGNLDRKNGSALVELLVNLARTGKAVLVVTHDEEQASSFDRVLRLREGRL